MTAAAAADRRGNGGGSPVAGLSSGEAARRLEQHGPNRAPRARPRTLTGRIASQLRDPMIMLLCAAFGVVVALGDLTDAGVIAAVVVLNTALGVVQEVRAENAIAALEDLSAPTAAVVRDGTVRRIDSALVVPGDLLRLEAGDVVAADAALVEAVTVQVDESAMTGESVPVDRTVDDEVLAGTVVTRGRGLAEVLRTGTDSGLGRIAALIATTEVRPTPLQTRLAGLSKTLVVITLALTGVVLVLGLLRGEELTDMLILAVSLAVAAIPESLPAVVSVALALGAYRMARRSAVVRSLPAVETLGSVTVLASDKTGTLTEGQMVVEKLWTPDTVRQVTGRGYGKEGQISGPPGADLDELLRALVLCNDAALLQRAHQGAGDNNAGGNTDDSADVWDIVGDPMEAALLVVAERGFVETQPLRLALPRVEEIPFDADRRMMNTLHHLPDPDDGPRRPHHLDSAVPGDWLSIAKGAPEALLAVVPDNTTSRRAHQVAQDWAHQGFRVIAVAAARLERRPDSWSEGLNIVGMVAITDPPRANAYGVIDACRKAGIRPVLITGDHPATAEAVATRLGIGGPDDTVADGAMVQRGDHRHQVERISVYARTKPEQKVDIVAAWQDRGEVVAMTGDGVNDGPALRRADVGVAMGGRGTEVARQAADLVLADDDLGTLIAAVAEGRRIYANIRTFLRYGLSGGVAEIAVILLAPFLGMPVPLLPAQILWINMLTHGIPGVAFGGEPLDVRMMSRPSAPPRQSVLGNGLGRQILLTGALITLISLAAGLYADANGQPVTSWVFLTLGLGQLGVALALRAPRRHASWRARGLEVAVALAVALQLLAVTWSPLGGLLSTEPLSWPTIAGLSTLSALPGLAVVAGRASRVDAPPWVATKG